MDLELKQYKALVAEMFERDSSVPFSNGKPSHAAAIFAEMLRRAKFQVLIFCKELAQNVYDADRDIIPALKDALKRNVDVSIIVQEEPMSPEFLKHAREYRDDREIPGEISILGCDSSHLLAREISLNFAVMDHKGIRAESDKGRIEAIGCANDPEQARALVAFFKDINTYIHANGRAIDWLAVPTTA